MTIQHIGNFNAQANIKIINSTVEDCNFNKGMIYQPFTIDDDDDMYDQYFFDLNSKYPNE